MKILVDFQDTIGGAPRSMLQHALALKNAKHDIIAVISENNPINFFPPNCFKVFYLPPFSRYNLVHSFFTLIKYYKLLKKEKIDLIYANRVIQSQYLSILSDISKTPILNARAGGNLDSGFLVSIHKHKPYIVYSGENLDVFINFGFNKTNLYLLKNRIPVPKYDQYNEKTNNEIEITFTGNIKSDTYKGIIWFMEFIRKNSSSINYPCSINIAGKNILKSHSENTHFQETLAQLKNLSKDGIRINLLGWIEKIETLQAKSDICIGKGRSICQPGMMGKISFVISESGQLFRCKEEIYSLLTYYNFSGRGRIIEKTNSEKEFLNLLVDKKYLRYYKKEAEKLLPKFRKDYSSEFLQEKIDRIITDVKNSYLPRSSFKKGISQILKVILRTTILWMRKQVKQ